MNTSDLIYLNFIDGKWSQSVSSETYDIYNPARVSEKIGSFQASTPEDISRAIDAADNASADWAATPAPERGALLYRALDLLKQREDEISETITAEEGKPIGDARGEVKRAMNIMEYAAGEGRRLFGYTTPSEQPNMVAYTIRRPLGAIAIITPWNFPIAIPAWKIAPALICGNTIVFTPASGAPLSAVKFTEIFEEVGLPAGVLNLVTGPGASIGDTLVEDHRLSAVSFTGSTEIGTRIYSRGAELLKKVQCEMGGKNAAIVLADADLDKALGGIVQGAFGSTGQRCTATSRAIVETSVYDEFMTKLIERTSALKIGDGIDPQVDVSPLASQYQLDKVLEYIGIGTEEGGRIVHGGKALTGGIYDQGYYVEPTIFTDVGLDTRIANEEIFGPVLTVFRAGDLDEAISISDQVQFGLSSSVYTQDLRLAHHYIDNVETGMVHVNAPTLGGEVHLPFGGIKASGVGQREQGTQAVEFFTEIITVYIDHSGAPHKRTRSVQSS